VSDVSIVWTTAKTGARTIIPILPATRALFKETPRERMRATRDLQTGQQTGRKSTKAKERKVL
jgi:hypothetical protein